MFISKRVAEPVRKTWKNVSVVIHLNSSIKISF